MSENTDAPRQSSGFAERLRSAMAGMSAEALAARILIDGETMSPSAVKSWRRGTSEPKLSNAAALATALQVRLPWLATGEGPMRSDDMPSSAQAGDALERHSADELGDDYILLPRYDVRAAAGAGAVIHSEQIVDYLSFKAEWIRHRLRRNPQYLLLIEAMGDSMEPLIADGDLLLLDTQIDHVRDNAIYALNIAGSLLVKRIIRRFDGGITIASDNDRYPAETLSATDAERIHVVGQVVWHAGVL